MWVIDRRNIRRFSWHKGSSGAAKNRQDEGISDFRSGLVVDVLYRGVVFRGSKQALAQWQEGEFFRGSQWAAIANSGQNFPRGGFRHRISEYSVRLEAVERAIVVRGWYEVRAVERE